MRRLSVLTNLAFLVLLGSVAMPAAAAPDAAPSAPQESTALQKTRSSIAPHRAIYTMSLASVKNGSNITEASGHMLFEWRDVCDGWAIQQHMQLHFSYTDGDDQDINSTELTWEAKNGKAYNFNIRRVTNGKETENYRGKASLKDDGSGTATYTVPEAKIVQLPAGTLFPSAHTQLILQKALLGEKLFSRRVFDGSDEDGASDITAFVSPQKPVATDASLTPELKKNAMLKDAAWPVHMAFYNIDSDASVPDYEMDLDLLPNGIARHMKIDYGDFAVIGILEDVQPLPSASCP